MSHESLGSDICECGDFRSQHYRVGFHSKEACAVCRCNVFRFFAEASSKDMETWNEYHGPKMLANSKRIGTRHSELHVWSAACLAPPRCKRSVPLEGKERES